MFNWYVTEELVYKDHPRNQQNVVLIHRWSLYAGLIAWKVHIWKPVNVVLISRWYLYTGGL